VFDTREQLLEKIRLGEDSFLECKEAVFAGRKIKAPGRDELADELAAFANARGGVLVLGVADKTREVVGIPIERLDSVEQFVAEVVRDSIKPPLYPVIERLELPDTSGRAQPVVRVAITRSLFVHQSPSGYLHRVGSSKRQMEPDYLARLFQQRSQTRLIRFDEQVVHDVSFGDLDPALVDRFRTPQTQDDRHTLARKLGMAAEAEGGELRPTVAGVLLGTGEPQRWLPHAIVQAVAYRGVSIATALDSREYQLDGKEIGGPLDAQIAEACLFVLRNQRMGATKHAGRRDLPQYDLIAIFEAIVNAVAHRDYSMHGAKIRLRMFSDRLELYSPGALANTMTVETLPYRQASRNETVTSLLAKCAVPSSIGGLETPRSTLMDRRGEGVAIILERSERLSGRRPVYELPDESELRLTIFAVASNEDGRG
jgi:predicted HTH transcriptional regulator